MLILFPNSPRNGSIVVAILTIFQFAFLIYAITSIDEFKLETAFVTLVVVFSIVCILSSLCLIIGSIRLNKRLILPYILLMSLFVLSYVIVFVVMITSSNHHQKDWIHVTIIAANICCLIASGSLYKQILDTERAESIQVTVAAERPPIYGYY